VLFVCCLSPLEVIAHYFELSVAFFYLKPRFYVGTKAGLELTRFRGSSALLILLANSENASAAASATTFPL
jgi:hypothetical protein